MQTKNRKLAAFAVTAAALALVVSTVTFGSKTNLFSSADTTEYDITLTGSNGAAAETSLKTKQVAATTALNNSVAFDYKNCEVVSGSVAKVKAKGYYGNADPIWAMGKIVVTSNAAAGDAVIKYGKTSACLDGSADLASGTIEGINANYFKIVATNDVTIASVKVAFSCDNSDNGFEATYGDDDKKSDYTFNKSGDHYQFYQKNSSSSHYVNKLVIPDYYGTGDDYAPVTEIAANSNYGLFEKAYSVKEVYFPETITKFGNYIWSGTHDYLTSLTYPRDLTTGPSSGYLVPDSSSLKTIYFNCKSLSYTGSYAINSSYQENLESVYVSYDVEKLPNSFMPSSASSMPSSMVVYYEGTTAEWGALTSSASNWAKCPTVICSDTTTSTVTFHYSDSTLNEDASGTYSKTVINGKEITSPGTPVWTGEGSKVFDGWYDAATGGNKISFPYTVNADADFYAQFSDMPSGYSLSDPKDVAIGTYDVETRADLGKYEYFRYTATKEEVINFRVTNQVSENSKNPAMTVYNADGSATSISTSSNSGAEQNIKDLAYVCNSSSDGCVVKIHFKAGDSYIVSWTSYSYTSYNYYGTATLTVSSAEDDHSDYRYATDYTVGTQATLTNISTTDLYWQKFTCEEDGTYTFKYNEKPDSSDVSCFTYIGTISGTTWTSIASGNNSTGEKFATLTAGTTYYIASRGVLSTGTSHFSIIKGTPAGYSADNAITMTVDGDAVTNNMTSYYYNIYKFDVATAGAYKITCSANLYYQYKSSYSSSDSSYQYVSVFSTSTMASQSEMVVAARHGQSSTDQKSVYMDLEAGTYYLKASAAASTAKTLAISSVSDVTGLTTTHPIALSMTATTTQIAVSDKTSDQSGTIYSFTAPTSQYYKFTSSEAGGVILGDTYTSSSVLKYFSPDSNAGKITAAGGELHKKLTAGTTYQLLVSGSITSLKVDITDTIEDGASVDTAYTYTLGTEEKTTSNSGRIGSTLTYFKYTPEETADYIARVGFTSTYYSYFTIYNGDTKMSYTTGATSYDRVFTLEAGTTYSIRAYSYGFTLTKATAGYSKGVAIAADITATTTSYTFSCTQGQTGTWYKFTADMTGFYEFKTESSATMEIYVGDSSTSAGTASTSAADVSVTSGDVVSLKVVADAGTEATFSISHPTSVQNGKSFDTAFEYANDEGQVYMSMIGRTRAANTDGTYCYIKVAVTANTEYVFYSIAASGDLDTINSATTGVVYGADQSAIAADFSDYDCGSSDYDDDMSSDYSIQDKTGSTNSSDFYTRFNTGDNTTVYLRYKLKDVDHKIAVRTAADFWAD